MRSARVRKASAGGEGEQALRAAAAAAMAMPASVADGRWLAGRRVAEVVMGVAEVRMRVAEVVMSVANLSVVGLCLGIGILS